LRRKKQINLEGHQVIGAGQPESDLTEKQCGENNIAAERIAPG
jgi:hypothetical protein